MVSTNNSNDEEYDSFPAAAVNDVPTLMFDSDSLAVVNGTRRAGRSNGGDRSRASRSAATTQLATDVGSTVGARKNPFLKSITFFDPKIYYRRIKDGENEGEDKNAVLSDGGEAVVVAAGSDDNSADNQHDNDDDMTFEINDLTHWDIILRDPETQEMQSSNRKGGIFSKLSKVSDNFKKSKKASIGSRRL